MNLQDQQLHEEEVQQEEQVIKAPEQSTRTEQDERVERLEQENAILKQNAAAAARAPVKGVSVGTVRDVPVSDFEKGLCAEPW